MLLAIQELIQFIMKRNTVKMSMGGPTGGGGLSADDILVLLWGNSKSGASTDPGAGLRYMDTNVSTESV